MPGPSSLAYYPIMNDLHGASGSGKRRRPEEEAENNFKRMHLAEHSPEAIHNSNLNNNHHIPTINTDQSYMHHQPAPPQPYDNHPSSQDPSSPYFHSNLMLHNLHMERLRRLPPR
eukprot:TRINITY_DN8612_c0_g1_i3.p1 TRINITY_DN8612_c0_g1~~TRINITY_DN8612_c0_g1_i3.p1  ORF type:complete len:115 (+),score=30.41 TRINITY_DN8612_c0_g1_i3:81-425(+)